MIALFIILAIYMALGIVYLWITIEYAKYEYTNSLQGIFIVLFWPLAIAMTIFVLISSNKITKDIDIEEKKKDEFKHL